MIGASLLTLIASFFPFFTVSLAGFIAFSDSASGWSSWWWIPILIAVAVGVVYALQMFGVLSKEQIKPLWLFYAAAASFVLMIGVLIHTFLAGPSNSDLADLGGSYSAGPSFGVWLALLTTLALTYFTALAAQSAGAKLPFKVPGPA